MKEQKNARYLTEYDRKGRQWKAMRQRQVRGYILWMSMTFLLVLGAACSYYMISNAQDQEQGVTYKYYTSVQVESGDSLWKLAEGFKDGHYGSTRDYVDEVVRINHLRDEDSIQSGQYLILPYYSEEYKR